MSLDELEAEMDAAFAVEKVRSEALRICASNFGDKAVYVIWRLGWISGQQTGLAKAREIMQ